MQNVKDFVDSDYYTAKKGPLDLVLCYECGLLQLRHTFSNDYLYTHYWYRSGTSPTMVKELSSIALSAEKLVELNDDDVVVDTGSNDGTLLKQYGKKSLIRIGFEPSNLWKLGINSNTVIINDFFSKEAFAKKFPEKKAKVITSIAMFYDLDDPNAFTQDIKDILDPEGLWIVQMNHLGLMVKNLGYDNICHEHVEYYSLCTMQYLLSKHNLEVFNVELNNVNGGSFRLYIKHLSDRKKHVNTSAIQRIMRMEKELGLSQAETFLKFDAMIKEHKHTLTNLISSIIKNGEKIFVYGASTRGLVILEYCGIDHHLIDYATDKNSDKWGKYLSGTGIRIISLDDYRKLKPDYLLVLPYQYTYEIAYQERTFLVNGGKLIVPLPVPLILDKEHFNLMDERKPEEFLAGYDKL